MSDGRSVYPSVFMLPGCDRRLRSGHPWAYSNEIRMNAEALALAPGTLVVLNRVDGKALGVGTFDPLAFVKSSGELKSGLKGYRKLARLAARLVEPGGFLFLASCSHNVEAGASADHPVHSFLPESAYLKTLVLQLD